MAATMLFLALQTQMQLPLVANPLPSYWRIGQPATLPKSALHRAVGASESLVRSRMNLVQLCTLSSFILFCHMSASRWKKSRMRLAAASAEGPVEDWPPRGEGRRTWLYTKFSVMLCFFSLGLRTATSFVGVPLWSSEFLQMLSPLAETNVPL